MNRDYAKYRDIMEFWDINEVMRANEWLDIKDDQEWLQQMEAEANAKAGR